MTAQPKLTEVGNLTHDEAAAEIRREGWLPNAAEAATKRFLQLQGIDPDEIVNGAERWKPLRPGVLELLKRNANNPGINPLRFNVLIEPKPVDNKIGSIIIPDAKQDADKFAQTEGRIIAMSPHAFTYVTAAEWDGNKPKPGDRVLHLKYGGVRVKGRDGKEYVLVKDEDIVSTIEE